MATFRADDVLGRSVELIDAVVQVLQEGHVGGEHPLDDLRVDRGERAEPRHHSRQQDDDQIGLVVGDARRPAGLTLFVSGEEEPSVTFPFSIVLVFLGTVLSGLVSYGISAGRKIGK